MRSTDRTRTSRRRGDIEHAQSAMAGNVEEKMISMRCPVFHVALLLGVNRVERHIEVSGDGVDAPSQGTVGLCLLVRFGEHPAEKGFNPVTGGHGIACTENIGFQFVGGIVLGMVSQVFDQMGEFVAEDECPGVRWQFAGGDRMDEDRAVIQSATDGGQGTGIFSECKAPFDFAAGGIGHLAGDRLKFGEINRWSKARIRIPRLCRPDGRGGRARWLPRDAMMRRWRIAGSGYAGRAGHERGGKCQQSGKISVSEWVWRHFEVTLVSLNRAEES